MITVGLGPPGPVFDPPPPPPQFVALERVNVAVFPMIVLRPRVDSTVTLVLPATNDVAGIRDHLPLAVTIVVPRIAPETFRRVIVAPELPLPEKFIAREVCPQASVRLGTGTITGVT